MIRLTYGDAKAQVAETAGSTGMPATDPRVLSLLNLAIQELMDEGEFPGVVDRWFLQATSGQIILPSHLDRLMQITIAGYAREIKSPWFEFVQYGPGVQDDARLQNQTWCGPDVIFDVGETPLQNPLPISDGSSFSNVGPWYVRVYATVIENQTLGVDPYCTVRGTDGSGLQVYTQLTDGSGTWIHGERIQISDGSSYTQSGHAYSQITSFTKPATNGYVKLTAWNEHVEIPLSTYAPFETTPSYHQYYSPWLQTLQSTNPTCRMVLARCRRRFVPVSQDTDALIISNLPALKEMMIAIWKRKNDAFDEYTQHKLTAVDLLNKEAMAYRGKSPTPAITIQRGFSMGMLPYLR